MLSILSLYELVSLRKEQFPLLIPAFRNAFPDFIQGQVFRLAVLPDKLDDVRDKAGTIHFQLMGEISRMVAAIP